MIGVAPEASLAARTTWPISFEVSEKNSPVPPAAKRAAAGKPDSQST